MENNLAFLCHLFILIECFVDGSDLSLDNVLQFSVRNESLNSLTSCLFFGKCHVSIFYQRVLHVIKGTGQRSSRCNLAIFIGEGLIKQIEVVELKDLDDG